MKQPVLWKITNYIKYENKMSAWGKSEKSFVQNWRTKDPSDWKSKESYKKQT